MRSKLAMILAAPLAVTLLSAGTPELRVRADQTPGTEAQVARGEQLFANCRACHGPEGEGRVGKAPRLRGDGYLSVVSNDYLYTTIRQGRPGTDMITWGTWLTQDETRDIVAYIRSWQQYGSVTVDESPLEGTVDRGRELFADRCSECHGDRALGYAEGGIGLGIGRYWFLEQASNGMIRAFVMGGKPETPMPAFSHTSVRNPSALTKQDIDSIIRYLRSDPK